MRQLFGDTERDGSPITEIIFVPVHAGSDACMHTPNACLAHAQRKTSERDLYGRRKWFIRVYRISRQLQSFRQPRYAWSRCSRY